jgi:hypothetical protein
MERRREGFKEVMKQCRWAGISAHGEVGIRYPLSSAAKKSYILKMGKEVFNDEI